MRTVWRSLLWKEWHEHKWKLVSVSAITCSVTLMVPLSAWFQESSGAWDVFIPVMMFAMLPLGIFLGAGEAAGEAAGGTLPLLQALPVPMWKAAASKLLVSIATVLIALCLALALVFCWYVCAETWGEDPQPALAVAMDEIAPLFGDRESITLWALAMLALVGPAAIGCLIWTAAIGVGRKTEITAAGSALLALAIWWSIIGLLMSWIESAHAFEAHWIAIPIAMVPPGSFVILDAPKELGGAYWYAVAAGIITYLTLVGWYIARFGRSADVGGFSRARATSGACPIESLAPPRRSPLRAIVWKQFRESGPIALAGCAGIFLIVAFNVLVNERLYTNPYQLAELLGGATAYIGFLAVLIAGIGVFDRDLTPKLHSFWRSRPISSDLWYWTKFATGLLVLAAALGGLLMLMLWTVTPYAWTETFSERTTLMVVPLLVAVYALAVAAIVLVRMAVYAAILSVGMLCAGSGIYWRLWNEQFLNEGNWELAVVLACCLTTVLAALVGWWAVRRDVGWRK